MTDNQFLRADAASEARGADPMLENGEMASASTTAATRSAFNFERKQGGTSAESSSATLKDKAIGRLQSEADNRKSVVSDQLKQVSSALGGIGGNGQSGDTPQWLTSGVGQATQFIDGIADNIENRNTAELIDDVKGFARANPAIFLGACALAGFVAMRIFAVGNGR